MNPSLRLFDTVQLHFRSLCHVLGHSLEEANSVGALLPFHCEHGAAIVSSTNRNHQHTG